MTMQSTTPTLVTLLSLAGCATPPLPAATPDATSTLVHVTSDDPSRPLVLYRAEQTVSGSAYTNSVPRSRGGPQDPDPSSQLRIVEDFVPRALCVVPCDHVVSDLAGEELFVDGAGITPSAHFRLSPRLGRVLLEASPRSAARTTAGTVFAVVGGLTALVGGVTLAATSATIGSADSSLPKAGGGLFGVGAALLGVGIPLLITGRTTYAFGRSGAAPPPYPEVAHP
jgi:hypothetical protein